MRYQLQDGTFYEFSYVTMKEFYDKHVAMTDEEFLENLHSALHLACFICWFKEIPAYDCLSDKGIIHELTHLLHIPNEPLIVLEDIRKLFKEQLKLT